MTAEELLKQPEVYNNFQRLERSIEHCSNKYDKLSLINIRSVLYMKALQLAEGRNVKIITGIVSFLFFVFVFIALYGLIGGLLSFLDVMPIVSICIAGILLYVSSWYTVPILQTGLNIWQTNKLLSKFSEFLERKNR